MADGVTVGVLTGVVEGVTMGVVVTVAEGGIIGVLLTGVIEGVVMGVMVTVTDGVVGGTDVGVPPVVPTLCSKLASNAMPAPVKVWVLSLIMAS